jgi:hypothetical protein
MQILHYLARRDSEQPVGAYPSESQGPREEFFLTECEKTSFPLKSAKKGGFSGGKGSFALGKAKIGCPENKSALDTHRQVVILPSPYTAAPG